MKRSFFFLVLQNEVKSHEGFVNEGTDRALSYSPIVFLNMEYV